MQDGPIHQLPDEVIAKCILSYFITSQRRPPAIPLVCRKWQGMHLENLLTSLLADHRIGLSLNDILMRLGEHSIVASRILKDGVLRKLFTAEEWLLLGKRHPLTAQALITDRAIFDQLDERDQITLYCHANIVFLMPLLKKEPCDLKDQTLFAIGEKHELIARFIFKTPGLLHTLSGHQIIMLLETHPSIQYETEDLFNLLKAKLTKKEWLTFAQLNSPVANKFLPRLNLLQETTLFSKNAFLMQFSKVGLEDAMLRLQLGDDEGSPIQPAHPVLTLAQLQSKEFVTTFIASMRNRTFRLLQQIAEQLKKDHNLMQELNAYFASLAISVQTQIANTLPKIEAKLHQEFFSGCLEQAIHEGFKWIELNILARQEISDSFNHHSLRDVARQYLSFAQKVISTPSLYNRLEPEDLALIGMSHPIIAKEVVSHPMLCAKLLSSALIEIEDSVMHPFLLLCHAQPAIIEQNQTELLTHPAMTEGLKTEVEKCLAIYNRLHELTRELSGELRNGCLFSREQGMSDKRPTFTS